VEIESDLAALPRNTALDGELTITNYFDMPSKEAYKAASKIIRLKGATPKRGLTYRVFDCMKADEFKMQSCIKPYVERRAELDSFPKMQHIEVLPVLYVGDDTSKITEWLDKITAEGGEGCMLNSLWAPYVWGRTWNLQKCKKFQSLDLLVVDMEEGSGRLAGTLGAIHVRYKDGNIVKVGSGFSDEERALYWAQPDIILNKIVEVKYFESSKNADGTESLRFPTWTSNIRAPRDKATPDF
jgi:DNA ligase-1